LKQVLPAALDDVKSSREEKGFSPATLAILQESMPNLAKLVFIRVCGYRGRNAIASVGFTRLARDLETTPRQIAEAIGWLERHAFIQVTRDYKGRPVAIEVLVMGDGPFIAVPNGIFNLPIAHGPKLLLIRLLLHDYVDKSPVGKLAKSLGVASDTVRRWALALRQAGLLVVGLSRGRNPNQYRLTAYVQRWREQPSQNGYALRDSVDVRTVPPILLRLQPFFPDRKLWLVSSGTRIRVIFDRLSAGGYSMARRKFDGPLDQRLLNADREWWRIHGHEWPEPQDGLFEVPGLDLKVNQAAYDLLDLDRAFGPSGSGTKKEAA
jgi:hypothetical protein